MRERHKGKKVLRKQEKNVGPVQQGPVEICEGGNWEGGKFGEVGSEDSERGAGNEGCGWHPCSGILRNFVLRMIAQEVEAELHLREVQFGQQPTAKHSEGHAPSCADNLSMHRLQFQLS